jgi:hypothetical protein
VHNFEHHTRRRENLKPSVSSQRQAAANYFDLSSAFGMVRYALLLHKLADYGNWFRSYLTNTLSRVRYSGPLSSHFEVIPGVPQGSALGPLLLNVLLIIWVMLLHLSIIFFFDDDIKNFRTIKSPQDCFKCNARIEPYKA